VRHWGDPQAGCRRVEAVTLPAHPPLDPWSLILLAGMALAAWITFVELWVRREKRKPNDEIDREE